MALMGVSLLGAVLVSKWFLSRLDPNADAKAQVRTSFLLRTVSAS